MNLVLLRVSKSQECCVKEKLKHWVGFLGVLNFIIKSCDTDSTVMILNFAAHMVTFITEN